MFVQCLQKLQRMQPNSGIIISDTSCLIILHKIGELELLKKVGLGDRMHHYPSQLSGGEQQRVAVARAFSNSPSILFADEPTGNLDEETGEKVIQLLFNLNKEAGTTLVIITHDLDLAARTQQILRLKGGRILTNETTVKV